MAHCISPEGEKILDTSFPVLDQGFIRLVDYMGNDERIVQAARVSYGKGTKSYREDRGLIRYLLRNEHTSPFEQVQFSFHIKMPIFVARQWVRHRTARINEISGRYSVLEDSCYLPDRENISPQSTDNKQARSAESFPEEVAEDIQQSIKEDQERSFSHYRALIDRGVAKELARINLPLSVYTEMYWQIDLHNLLHFIQLRIHPHAQLEIRKYGEVLLTIVERVCPLAAEAFKDYILDSVSFSGPEKEALKDLLQGQVPKLTGKDLSRFKAKLE